MTAVDGDPRPVLEQRLAKVRERVAAACHRAGRNPKDVTLVAVTKTAPPPVAALLPALGVLDLGESRPQELWRKAALLPGAICWHLVGHLQRNKVERTLPLVGLIHSVDSWRLLAAIDAVADPSRPASVLLEVNMSREPNKHGFAPEELPAVMPRLADLRNVHARGLMTMAAEEANPERCRPTFAGLRQLRDELRSHLPGLHRLEHLSMGMSDDYEVAVEEGATFVRIGTALFQGLGEEGA